MPDDPDEFYDHQLVGLTVVDHGDGTVLGTVAEVLHPPAAPCSRWTGRTARRNWCRSCRRSCRTVDLAAGRLVVDPPDGMFDLMRRPMRINVITIFPGYLDPLRESLLGKAIADDVIELGVHDLRDWTTDRHRTVDDSPYGGGPGMVMKPDVWGGRWTRSPSARAAAADADRADAGRSTVHPGHGDGAGREPSIWSSPAAGTRASTSG